MLRGADAPPKRGCDGPPGWPAPPGARRPMYHDYDFKNVLAASTRANWRLEDVIGPESQLDFARCFLPEPLARTDALPGLSADERRVMNQIRGHEYLCLFGLVE